MVFHDIKLASYMAADNIFGGIILPSFIIGILSGLTVVMLLPVMATPALGIPVLIFSLCIITAISASIYAQIPLEGKIKAPLRNALMIVFSAPVNALLYPLYSIFTLALSFPVTLFMLGINYWIVGNIENADQSSGFFLTQILLLSVLNTMWLGFLTAGNLALWAYNQLPKAENIHLNKSLSEMFALTMGSGIRGAIASIILYPISAAYLVEFYFLKKGLDIGEPSLILGALFFFTSLLMAVAIAIPFLTGIAFLRRAFFNEHYSEKDLYQDDTSDNDNENVKVSFLNPEKQPEDHTKW